MKMLLNIFMLFKWIGIAYLAIAVMSAMAKKNTKGTLIKEKKWPFSKKKPLSNPEQVLFHRLVAGLPDHVVLAQVQLSRILNVNQRKDWRSWLNKIDRKSLDFVICRKDFGIVAAIELDDSSHEREDRRKADADKNRALEAADIKLIRWQVANLPDLETIKLAIIVQPPVDSPPGQAYLGGK